MRTRSTVASACVRYVGSKRLTRRNFASPQESRSAGLAKTRLSTAMSQVSPDTRPMTWRRSGPLVPLLLAGTLMLGHVPWAMAQYKPVVIYNNDNYPQPPSSGPGGYNLDSSKVANYYCTNASGGVYSFTGTWLYGRSPSVAEAGAPLCSSFDTNPANRVRADYRCGAQLESGPIPGPGGIPTCSTPGPEGVYDDGKIQGNPCPKTTPDCGNPISVAVGNKVQKELDYRAATPFPLVFARTYNSTDSDGQRIGRRWRHSYERRLVVPQSEALVRLLLGDGQVLDFYRLNSGAYAPDIDLSHRLVRIAGANNVTLGWELTTQGTEDIEAFDAAGRLTSITTRSGLTQTLTYSDGTASPPDGGVIEGTAIPLPAGLLIFVTDSFGRSLSFGYDDRSYLVRMTDPAGGNYLYAYDAHRTLSTVTYPDGRIRTYHYNEPEFAGTAQGLGLLTGITDENGDRFATFWFDSLDRAIRSEHAGDNDRFDLTFNADFSVTVTNPLGAQSTYTFENVQGVPKSTAIVGAVCPSCGPASASYDNQGNVTARVDWNGNRTDYAYDLTRNLETQRVEGLTSGGGTTPQSRSITTEWHPTFRLKTRVAEPLRITNYAYNGDGGAQCGSKPDGTLVPGVLCSKTVQPTADATGAQGLSAVPTGPPRTWAYTYNAIGRLLTVDGPRADVADVTTYTYYADDDPDVGKRGNVATITNAAGHVTQITAYNDHGQPTTIVDPNGLPTTLSYDPRQRLTSRSVGGETTSYEYDGVGQLTRVTLPDGSFLTYSYDGAHRLTGMQDSLGNRVAYTLDAMGNRIQEQVFDPTNSLAQTRSRVYSNLNRLFQEIGALGQTTEYAYDDQGNVVMVKDPLNHTTTNAYDALNRLVKVTDPNAGVTAYGYNGLDALTSVIDPRGLMTGYAVDGLGNLAMQTSPDTGVTANTYDAAGNLLTRTDAKGQTTTYAYDALNRVTSISFHDGSRQTYLYDQGANSLGRLSAITETNPAQEVTSQIAYDYDPHGRVTSETRNIGGQSHVTAYGYDAAGRLSAMTYPSGRNVAYTFDPLGRINQITTTGNGQTAVVVQGVYYHPFGGVKGFTFGNGQVYSRTVDQDGRIASYTLGAARYDISFDAASRIVGIAEMGNPSNANAYGYDNLDRLTSADVPSSSYTYSYDAVGNRLTKLAGGTAYTYSYSPTSNRIDSVTSSLGSVRNFVFDANGSTTADGVNTYAYDARGRMAQATSSFGVTTYQVNALGQRVRKTNTLEDTVFHYDTRGHLIAESDAGGATKREYIYLGDIPVGVVQ